MNVCLETTEAGTVCGQPALDGGSMCWLCERRRIAARQPRELDGARVYFVVPSRLPARQNGRRARGDALVSRFPVDRTEHRG